MGWRGRRCPVAENERIWIEESLAWLRTEFGDARPAVLPTAEFFPAVDDVAAVVDRVCGYLGVDRARIEVELVDDVDHAETLAGWGSGWHGAAGVYSGGGSKARVSLSAASTRDPMALIATIAHELGHERLLGESRIDPSRRDHEPLTDLLTVHFGLGIFSANAAFDFTSHRTGWRSRTQGYLTEPMYGYALARYTLMRDDLTPAWSRYLDPNPRAYLKRSLRYLAE